MKDHVYVSTYCRTNSYGSILQSYGLKCALSSLGYESTVVQCMNTPSSQYQASCKGLHPYQIGIYLQNLRVLSGLRTKYTNTLQFLNEHMDLAYYPDAECMKRELKQGKVFLAGSDQVWNPLKLAPEFFLDFAPKNARKLSYAASMGVLDIPEQKKARFCELLGNFDILSAREQDDASLISKMTHRTVHVHIDPSFFCDADEWRKLSRPYPIKKPYILVYPIFWDRSLNQALRELRKTTDKEIVVILDYHRRIYSNKCIYDADPAQFLWLLEHADGVVTSSFHGVALAINYNKAFVPVINPQAPSRIEHLLKLLGCPRLKVESLKRGETIDYEKINQRIQAEKQRGLSFLKEMLEV